MTDRALQPPGAPLRSLHGGGGARRTALRLRTAAVLGALALGALWASATAPAAVPNDPSFGLQWAARNSGQEIPFQDSSEELGPPKKGTPGVDDRALAAWGIGTGTPAVVVGVLDSGVQYSHPDLAANIWSNPGGVGGCPAGTHGVNLIGKNCEPQDEDESYGGHGTHVAGIIGAVGNNALGVAGIDWQTTILPVKWVQSAGVETTELLEALRWLRKAREAGVNIRVVNDSLTFPKTPYSSEVKSEIEALGALNILFVTAAGNTGENNDEESVRRYPCGYDLANEICVTATNNRGELPAWANYGPHTVDLSAPGVSIYSTLRGDGYGYLTGGSMASAQVAGAAALILSAEPGLSPAQLKARILGNVDRLPSLQEKVITGGTLDLCRALPGCPRRPAVETLAASAVGQTTATLNAGVNPKGSEVSECKFEYGTTTSYGSRAPCLPEKAGSGLAPVSVSAAITGLSASTTYHFRVVAKNAGGESKGSDAEFKTTTTPPPKPAVRTEPASSVGQSTATLNGLVNPNGANVSECKFEYGTSTSYDSSAPCAQTVGSGTSNVAVSAPLGGLSANTTYHFRIVARNEGGTAEGADQAFTSSAAVGEAEGPPAGQPAGSVSQPGRGGAVGVAGSRGSGGPSLTVLPALLGRSLRVAASGALRASLGCPPGFESCTGTLKLRVLLPARRGSAGAGPGGKPPLKLVPVTVASARFTIAPGKSRAVVLRLSLAARRLLARVHRLRGEAILAAPGLAGGSPGTGSPVSLRASVTLRGAS